MFPGADEEGSGTSSTRTRWKVCSQLLFEAEEECESVPDYLGRWRAMSASTIFRFERPISIRVCGDRMTDE
jgi:hypothetical protein